MKYLLTCLLFTSLSFAGYRPSPCSPGDPCDTCNPCPLYCEPCEEVKPCPPPENCGFAAPFFREVHCPKEMFIEASFIYWQAKQANMELGVNEAVT